MTQSHTQGNYWMTDFLVSHCPEGRPDWGLCHLVPDFHDFLGFAHMTLTVRSVRSVGYGVLNEQILSGANFMLIGPQGGFHCHASIASKE